MSRRGGSSAGTSTADVTDWRDEAVCVDVDPEVFFPIGDTSRPNTPAGRQADMARAFCRRCPVAELCQSWALARPALDGVWGGLTLQERDSIRRRQTRARRGVI